MSPTLKAALALIFTAALGWLLLQPVLDAVERGPVVTRPGSSATPETTETGDPSPRATETEAGDRELPEEFRTGSLVSPYPRRCLRAAPPDTDLIAVDRGDAIAAGPRDGPLTEFPGDRLFGVAVDGRVAGRAGNEAFLGGPGGGAVHKLPGVGLVVWSPVSPCGVAVSRGGALVVLPSERPLLNGDVIGAAFSPSGRLLAVVSKDDEATSLWVASLSTGEMREMVRERADAEIELRGWAPNNKTVYYTPEPGGLAFVTTSDPPQSARVSADAAEELELCGGRLLGIVEGAIVTIDRRGVDEVASGAEEYRYLSCSPDGRFIAAIGRRGLVLLDANGGFLRDLTEDSGYTDVFVDWGEAGAGLLFGRVGSDPVAAELWYLPEGGSARPTGITYRGGPRAVDWAASPPTGMP